jgi:serine/threonine-protein kinase
LTYYLPVADGTDDQRTAVDSPAYAGSDGDLIGVDVGGYVIDGELGRGGMGVVFAATHPMIGKRAAIKVLKPSVSNNPATVARFIQEARAVNQIGHPNIVDIFAFGTLPDGRSYLVMDLLEGESLRRRVKRGPLTIAEATHVIDEIASALIAAHDKGFIHRDLKPDNVFLVQHPSRSECKLLDFGLAKLLPHATTERAYRTATGAQIGTPDYMSPEQLQGVGVDWRTDIFALGVLAFEILVGERPRRFSDGTFELGGHTVAETIIAKAKPPKELAQLVETMLSHDPKRRPSLNAVRAVLKRARNAVPATSVIGMEVSLPPVRPNVAPPPTGTETVDAGPRRPSQQPQVQAQPQVPALPQVHAQPQHVAQPQPPSSPALRTPTQQPPLSQPAASSGAGLQPVGHGGTKLGVAPAPRVTDRLAGAASRSPSRPHPIASARPRNESRVWLIVGIMLLLASVAALVFVLAR